MTLTPHSPTIEQAGDGIGQRLRRFAGAAGRGLWHAVGIGPDEPPWPRLRLRWSGTQSLVVLVIAFLVLMLIASAGRQLSVMSGGAWWPVALLLTVALLVLMLHRPLLAWRFGWLALLYELLLAYHEPLGYPVFPPLLMSEFQLIALLVLLLVVAISQPLPVAAWVWLLSAGLAWTAPVSGNPELAIMITRTWVGDRYFHERPRLHLLGDPAMMPYQVAVVVVVTLVVAAGQLVRRQNRTRQQLHTAQEHGLVLAERARIARELHDVVAHHLSMIAVRAETAPYRLEAVAPAVREEFGQLSKDARTALTEMRRLLGVLRSEDSPAPTAPQPSLTGLADLVEPIRAAGTSVNLEMSGAMAGLPPAVDVCGYRIVQEGLTNAAQHSPGAPIKVCLRRSATELVVQVRNEAAPARRAERRPAAGEGHGLRGMRERVTMLGGTLHAGPTDDGGYEVSAVLPLNLRTEEPA